MQQLNSNIVFCLDTSAFVDMHRFYGQKRMPQLWLELNNLFKLDRMISHRIVFNELTTDAKYPSPLSLWISSKKRYFMDMNGAQALYVSSIINQFPGLISFKHIKEQADPWLIALILDLKTNLNLFSQNTDYVMVTQESKLSSTKIPAVCSFYGIETFDIHEFFDFNSWKITFQK